MTQKVVRTVQLIDWQKQLTKNAVDWAKYAHKADGAELLAFEAGHEAGWRDCINTLKLHGLLITK